MKKIKDLFLVLFLVSFIPGSCDIFTYDNDDHHYSLSREFWGLWERDSRYPDSGSIYPYIFLSADGMYTSSSGDSWKEKIYNTTTTGESQYTFEKTSSRELEIYLAETRRFHFSAVNLTDSSFIGRVVALSGESAAGHTVTAAFNSAAHKNKSLVVSSLTAADGSFVIDGIIINEPYRVTVDGQTQNFTPLWDGDNLGIITLSSGAVLHTVLNPASNYDMQNLYTASVAANQYKFTIVAKNTGKENLSAPSWELIPDDGIEILSMPSVQRLATIEPGKSREIPITLKCNPFSGDTDTEIKGLHFKITDVLGRTWENIFFLKFNQVKPETDQ